MIIFNICFDYSALKRQNSWPPDVSALDALNEITRGRDTIAEKKVSKNKRYVLQYKS